MDSMIMDTSSSIVEERAIDVGNLLDPPAASGTTTTTRKCSETNDSKIVNKEYLTSPAQEDKAINNHYQNGRILEEHRRQLQMNQQEQQTSFPSQVSHHQERLQSHNHSNHVEANQVSLQQFHHQLHPPSTARREFLPLCDLLFNAISLIVYFTDVLFDIIIIRSLRNSSQDSLSYFWWKPMLFFLLLSLVSSQYLSFKWFLRTKRMMKHNCVDGDQRRNFKSSQRRMRRDSDTNGIKNAVNCCLEITLGFHDDEDPHHKEGNYPFNHSWKSKLLFGTHLLQLGVLLRYLRLFIPVNLLTVKHEVRDLCMLRMVHAFAQAAPMLLIQVYLVLLKSSPDDISDTEVTSILLSLFSLSWALASFSKNARRRNLHKLILTWLGVIFQFIWRVGMISSRIVSLTVYAVIYHEFVLVAIFLHWVSMILWLFSPKNLFFYGEEISKSKRFLYSLLLGWIYIFCYINLHETGARPKMIAYYLTMFLENTLLASVSLASLSTSYDKAWFYQMSIILVWGGFSLGLLSCLLYYQYFHSRHIQADLLTAAGLASNDSCNNTSNDFMSRNAAGQQNEEDQSHALPPPYSSLQEHNVSTSSVAVNHHHPSCRDKKSHSTTAMMMTSHSSKSRNETGLHIPSRSSLPGMPVGVFSCRLNPVVLNLASGSVTNNTTTATTSKRKKKKPSSFVPPPPTTTSVSTVPSAPSNSFPVALEGLSFDGESGVASTSCCQSNGHHLQQKQQQELQLQGPHHLHTSDCHESQRNKTLEKNLKGKEASCPSRKKFLVNSFLTSMSSTETKTKKKCNNNTSSSSCPSTGGEEKREEAKTFQEEVMEGRQKENQANVAMTFMNKSIGSNSLLPSSSFASVGHSCSAALSLTKTTTATTSASMNAIRVNQGQNLMLKEVNQSVAPGEEKRGQMQGKVQSSSSSLPFSSSSLALPTRKVLHPPVSSHFRGPGSFSSALSSLFQATNSIHSKIAATGIAGMSSTKTTQGFNHNLINTGIHSRPQVQSARLFESRRNAFGDDCGTKTNNLSNNMNGRHSCNIWQQNHHPFHQQHTSQGCHSRIFRSALSQGNLNLVNGNNLTTRLTPVHTIVHSTATVPSNLANKKSSDGNNFNKSTPLLTDTHEGSSRNQMASETNLDLIQQQLQRQQEEKIFNDQSLMVKQKLQEKRARELEHLQLLANESRNNNPLVRQTHQVMMMGRSSVPVGRDDLHRRGLSQERDYHHQPPPPPSRPPPTVVHPIPFHHHPTQHVFGGYKSIGHNNRRSRGRNKSQKSSGLDISLCNDLASAQISSEGRNVVDRPGHFTPHVGFPSDKEMDYSLLSSPKSNHYYYEANDNDLASHQNHNNNSWRKTPKEYRSHHYSRIKSFPSLPSAVGLRENDRNLRGAATTTASDNESQASMPSSYVALREEAASIKRTEGYQFHLAVPSSSVPSAVAVPSSKRSRKPIRVGNFSPSFDTIVGHHQGNRHHHNHSNHRIRSRSGHCQGSHHNSSDDGDVDSDLNVEDREDEDEKSDKRREGSEEVTKRDGLKRQEKKDTKTSVNVTTNQMKSSISSNNPFVRETSSSLDEGSTSAGKTMMTSTAASKQFNPFPDVINNLPSGMTIMRRESFDKKNWKAEGRECNPTGSPVTSMNSSSLSSSIPPNKTSFLPSNHSDHHCIQSLSSPPDPSSSLSPPSVTSQETTVTTTSSQLTKNRNMMTTLRLCQESGREDEGQGIREEKEGDTGSETTVMQSHLHPQPKPRIQPKMSRD